MNPIELVFSYLKKKVSRNIYQTKNELIKATSKTIMEMKLKTVNNIINHNTTMLKRAWKWDPLI